MNEFTQISLAYHIVITYIYCNLCCNYLYIPAWRVHSLPTIDILNPRISSCHLGHTKCRAVVVLLCCSAPKPWVAGAWAWTTEAGGCKKPPETVSGRKINKLSLLKRIVSAFIPFHSFVKSESKRNFWKKNYGLFWVLSFCCWPGLAFLCLGLWYLRCIKATVCSSPPDFSIFFKIHSSTWKFLVLTVEFGSLEAPHNMCY